MIAMQLAGVDVESYDAYEIDKYAVKTAQHNFPMIREHGDVFNADFTQYEGVDFLVGGSPCTYWSIAQTKNRETVASGMGWELFSQYVRALKEAKPKYFIYENNKSMSKAIRASIDEAFGFEAVLINSALVSAQNRQRLYWVGKRNADGTYSKVNVEQPKDRGILLKDVLDSAVAWREKAYTIDANYYKATDGTDPFGGHQSNNRMMAAERIPPYGNEDKSRPVCFSYAQQGAKQIVKNCYSESQHYDYIAEPVCLRYERTEEAKRCRKAYEAHEIKHGYNELNELHPRPDGKSNTLTTVLKDNQIMESICVAQRGKMYCGQPQHYEARTDGKTNTLTSVEKDNRVAEPIEFAELSEEYYKGCSNGNLVGMIENEGKYRNGKQPSQQYRAYSCEGKSLCVDADSRKCYMMPYAIEFDADGRPIKAVNANGKEITIYEVKDGKITIKGKQYPIKLADGYYIIRKLTVSECKRLQTVPEWYDFSCVSNSQAFKMLGNGWTCLIISHLIKACLEPTEHTEETECGEQYCLF